MTLPLSTNAQKFQHSVLGIISTSGAFVAWLLFAVSTIIVGRLFLPLVVKRGEATEAELLQLGVWMLVAFLAIIIGSSSAIVGIVGIGNRNRDRTLPIIGTVASGLLLVAGTLWIFKTF